MIGHNEEDRLMLEEHHKSEHYGEILDMRRFLCCNYLGGIIHAWICVSRNFQTTYNIFRFFTCKIPSPYNNLLQGK